MTRVSAVALLILVLAYWWLPAIGETAGEHNSSAQDLVIKREVETALSLLQAIFTKHQQGDMTLKQAKTLGADLLRALRYGTDGYFWADTEEGVNVVMYGSDVEGRSRLEDTDQQGTLMHRISNSHGLVVSDHAIGAGHVCSEQAGNFPIHSDGLPPAITP